LLRELWERENFGELQPFEFVISLMIANLATIPMSETGVPIFDGIIPIFGLLTMHLLIAFLNMKSMKFRRIVCGKPEILIDKGKIDEVALKRERMDLTELEEKLREKNVFNFEDVDYVILETNGEISVIMKPDKRPAVPADFGIEAEFGGIPYDLILDGKIMYDNLKKIDKDEKWLIKQVKKFKTKPEEVLIATINEKGSFFCQKKTT